MKKAIFIIIATLLLTSCWKSYYADRPPKKWNDEYATPAYIYDHRNSIAEGDTVMVVGWFLDTVGNWSFRNFCISMDSGYVSNGIQRDMVRGTMNIRICSMTSYLTNDLYFDFPDKPCKVYITGRFHHMASQCHCDWLYYLVPMTEQDVVFEPVNK
jgi:hypothetical protein